MRRDSRSATVRARSIVKEAIGDPVHCDLCCAVLRHELDDDDAELNDHVCLPEQPVGWKRKSLKDVGFY